MDESGELDHTGFLLQRLQELKNWQKQQEEQLLKEQDYQMDQLFNSKDNVDGDDDDDDDTTIDQDLSSLHSEVNQSLPSWASRSSSSMRHNSSHNNPDEKPIVPVAKTFEELLQENLEKEQQDLPFALETNPESR